MILFWWVFVRIGRAGQALWRVVTDRPTSRRVPWRYLLRRALTSPRIWLQVATIVAVLVIYPASFFLAEETRDPVIEAIMVLWLVTAVIPVVQRLLAGPIERLRTRS